MILIIFHTCTPTNYSPTNPNKKYHPDKCQGTPSASSSFTSYSNFSEDEAESAFQKIQLAWECLRDQDKRLEYDDALKRMREKNNSMLSKAKSVKLSEMNCELCNVEDEDDDQNQDQDEDGDNHNPQKLYSHECRCGDIFEILEEELQGESSLWECQSCCLTINIVMNA
jgi:curved DNA-binding protein CbpA